MVREQTDAERLSDQVSAAMETGNPDQARLLVKEHEETYPEAVQAIRRDVLTTYGLRL